MSLFKQQMEEFEEELKQNQRLRWGVYSIVVIALVYCLLELGDINFSLDQKYNQLANQKREVASIASVKIWQERVDIESASLKVWEEEVWSAGSEALVRANIQSKISEFAESSNLEKFNLKVGTFQQHPELPNVKIVRYEIDVSFIEDDILDFVNQLESNLPMLKIDRLSIRNGKRRHNANILGLAFFSQSRGG